MYQNKKTIGLIQTYLVNVHDYMHSFFLLSLQTFLSEKYGHCPLLPSIEATEFEKLLEVITDEDVLKLLERCVSTIALLM